MTVSKTTQWIVLAAGCAIALAPACGPFESHNIVVLNSNLVIPAMSGGTAEVTFLGLEGQTLTISLVGHKLTMVPFATLVSPSGAEMEAVPVSSAVDNTNSGEVDLTTTGTYRLIVMDDTGDGGTVTVRIER